MSLKARIEAVIYAAEEPVTLAQLASLFREEALALCASRIAPIPDALEANASEPEEVVDELLSSTSDFQREAPIAEHPIHEPLAPDTLDGDVPPAPSVHEGTPSRATENGIAVVESIKQESPDDSEKKASRQSDREAREEIRALIDELIADYNSPDSGLEIREVAGGFRIGTRPEYHDAVRTFIKALKPPMKLSLQALETLAVIAYKQPVTAPEIGDVRGVDSGGVLGSLIARKLITTAGRKQVLGRPILYKTTKEFLLRFGLKDLNELPSIEEFEKMATELAETEEDGPIAPGEELPFAQNEIAALEEEGEAAPERDPDEGAPSMHDPVPDVSEPPIHEPNPEPEPAPTAEEELAEHAESHRS
jgi:segregation and condensation protein B